MREPVEWPTRDLLTHRASVTPERTALVDVASDRQWTYDAADDIVDGLAAGLEELGVGAPDRGEESTPRVAFLLSTRIAGALAIHATHRLGAGVVLLDPRHPVERLGSMASRADPDGIVCEAPTADAALALTGHGDATDRSRASDGNREPLDCPVACVDAMDHSAIEVLQPAPTGDGDETAQPEPAAHDRTDEAFVAFTSGTTGEPKGVRLTMGNLVASATASAVRLGSRPDDRWLCCLPISHMGGVSPVLRTTLYGTTLVVQSEFDTTATARVIDQRSVTQVSLVPTLLHRLLADGWTPPATLRTVLLGGAPASTDLLADARDAGVPVCPTYGTTETGSQIATALPGTEADHPETVGQPLLFTEVTIIDDGEPVRRRADDPDEASAATGEIVVEGPTVTPGYLDDERTEAVSTEWGLRTGDLGYRDSAGRLWVLGRTDDQIVSGGDTVNPDLVADVLRTHPDVRDCSVVGRSDPEWGQRVVALVVPESSPISDLDAHARDHLPAYAVPKTIEFADKLPRTASGTVDREAVRSQFD